MGLGNYFPTSLKNCSRTHRVWVIVSVKLQASDEYDKLFQVALEPGTMSPEGVDVDFVAPYEGAPDIRYDGRSAGPGAWWKLGSGVFGPSATIDDGPNNTLLLSSSWITVETQSGAQLEKWGVTKSSWPEVSGGKQAVRVPGVTPPPPPPVTSAPLPGPPAGSRPGAGAPPPPPQNTAPGPSRPSGPPPKGLPPAVWLTGVQARLKYLAYYDGPIHDKFDTPTRNAVLSFQSRHGLKVDGIPGPKTQARLVEVVGA